MQIRVYHRVGTRSTGIGFRGVDVPSNRDSAEARLWLEHEEGGLSHASTVAAALLAEGRAGGGEVVAVGRSAAV